MMTRAVSLLLTVVLPLWSPPVARAEPEPPVRVAVFDDFDGAAGSLPSAATWDASAGPYRDASLQTYTSSPDNVRLDGLGHLVIQARRTPSGYTSARVVTRGRLNMLYGTVTARIKFPAGQGIWPAFWMLGSNYDQVGWPRSGEIDIMEIVNAGSAFHVTLHGPQGGSDYFGGAETSGQVVGASGPIDDLAQGFHEYWLDWKPDSIAIGVDQTTLGTFMPSSLPPGAEWVFNRPMFAVLNIAVGGAWPGPPDATTPFPATMLIDWFRYNPAT